MYGAPHSPARALIKRDAAILVLYRAIRQLVSPGAALAAAAIAAILPATVCAREQVVQDAFA
jgi:hypothetical protein